jgi:hypothetical protein
VVRDDDGVETILGNIEGDREEVRCELSGCGVGGVFGIGGGACKTDNLFALLASVGLMVRAPRPVMCDGPEPGITDIRLVDEGVTVRLLGDFVAKEADLACSVVFVLTVRCIWPCLEGGCNDFAFAAREEVRRPPST